MKRVSKINRNGAYTHIYFKNKHKVHINVWENSNQIMGIKYLGKNNQKYKYMFISVGYEHIEKSVYFKNGGLKKEVHYCNRFFNMIRYFLQLKRYEILIKQK